MFIDILLGKIKRMLNEEVTVQILFASGNQRMSKINNPRNNPFDR